MKGVTNRGRGTDCSRGRKDCSRCRGKDCSMLRERPVPGLDPDFQPDCVEAEMHDDIFELGVAGADTENCAMEDTDNRNVNIRPILGRVQKAS